MNESFEENKSNVVNDVYLDHYVSRVRFKRLTDPFTSATEALLQRRESARIL